MRVFATEFPIKPVNNRAYFVAQVMAWLHGTKYSTVLNQYEHEVLETENAYLRSASGEELRFREISDQGNLSAIGFRHDFADNDGRLWRTEVVIVCGAGTERQDLIRIKTQCIAVEPNVKLEFPRKPYIIKSMLNDSWGGKDNLLEVSDKPIWLKDNKESIDLAKSIVLGQASRFLPVIYLSARGASTWLLERSQIEKLAYDLGGVAHVIVEPSKKFSFDLRDKINVVIAHGGRIGISLPGQGFIRKFFPNWKLQVGHDLLTAVKSASIYARSEMPSKGWDWTELQEQALQKQRIRDRSRLNNDEIEKLYLEEIANLRDRIKQLEEEVAVRSQNEVSSRDEEGILSDQFIERIGSEIYPGEFSDRIRLAAKLACQTAEQTGLDRRSKVILTSIIKNLPVSHGLIELIEDLERATKNPKRLRGELSVLLSHHGYMKKANNKHYRMEANIGYDGLDSITLPNTPSEIRGLSNLRKQIERTLGISKLSD
ncbi:hypothetical protein JL100_033150 (plasmid) [Skermanella mucosa]|uniref:hypothetical protein n=1 Tax=Skermanella mucosa TaxID=1789672 RepID=UPI00192B6F36|nr:hypothetical protein [Skermanella mucosa]UEM24942.1 hypothetical protein JL100_033150 [Skermanella mucosa]